MESSRELRPYKYLLFSCTLISQELLSDVEHHKNIQYVNKTELKEGVAHVQTRL